MFGKKDSDDHRFLWGVFWVHFAPFGYVKVVLSRFIVHLERERPDSKDFVPTTIAVLFGTHAMVSN